MTLLRVLVAELRKAATLPATLAAAAVAVLGSLAVTILNATSIQEATASGDTSVVAYTSAVEAAFSAVPLGTVGAVILGVVAMSSEYTANSPDAGGGRQIGTTLVAAPRRVVLFAAKALAVVLLTVVAAFATITVSLVVAHLVIGEPFAIGDVGDAGSRVGGAAVYWSLMALIALAVTTLTRNGIVPLVVLIVNSSLVSVSFLLTRVTTLAFYLPDMAGMRLMARDTWEGTDAALDPLTGGLVMGAWAAVMLAGSAVVFVRRDA